MNNKLEKRNPPSLPCGHKLETLTPPLELLNLKHDSRLYEGISVHVCIYLFMCNLMGIVNMVRLWKLLFFIYLVPPVLVGLDINNNSSSCDFMVLIGN